MRQRGVGGGYAVPILFVFDIISVSNIQPFDIAIPTADDSDDPKNFTALKAVHLPKPRISGHQIRHTKQCSDQTPIGNLCDKPVQKQKIGSVLF